MREFTFAGLSSDSFCEEHDVLLAVGRDESMVISRASTGVGEYMLPTTVLGPCVQYLQRIN